MTDPRNLLIAALAMISIVLGVLLVRGDGTDDDPAPAIEGEESVPRVSVLAVNLEQPERRSLDVVFDRPLGAELVGEALERDAGTFQPPIGGSWRWVAGNVLRFEPSGVFAPATRYELELRPERFLPEGDQFAGETEYAVQTDGFQVESIQLVEEPEASGGGVVRLSGTIQFNYPVEPEELMRHMRLTDPAGGEPVELGLRTYWQSNVIHWQTVAITKQEAARTLELRVISDLTPADGNVSLEQDHVHPVPLGSRTVMTVRSWNAIPAVDHSTIEILLSSPVKAEIAKRYVTTDPEVPLEITSQANTLRIKGPFRPETGVEISIGAGLPSDDGASLPAALTERIQFGPLPPKVAFIGEGMFLSAQGARALDVETTNITSLELTVDRVYRNNVLYLMQQQGSRVRQDRGWGSIAHVFGDRIATKKIRVGGQRNRPHRTRIALDEIVTDEEPGLYRVAVKHDNDWQLYQRWVLITDLGAVVKVGTESVWAWVSSFSDLAPMAGTRVRVFSDQNQPIASGRTDARGIAHLTGLGEKLADERAGWVTLERGGDWSFVDLAFARIETSAFDVGGAVASKSGYDAFVYGERDLYRPGETARGMVLVRETDGGVAPAMPVRLRHRDPLGAERGAQTLTLGADGSAAFELPLAEAARTGQHSFEVLVGEDVVGRHAFHVESFVPDRIRVDVEPTGDVFSAGRPLVFDVASQYLFGPPAAALPAEARVRIGPTDFSPPGFEEFAFGDPKRRLAARQLLEEETALDAEGRARFEVALPDSLEAPAAVRAVITTRVRERGGRGVSALRRVLIHPVPAYIGLRAQQKGHADPGVARGFEWVVVDPDGIAVPSGTLQLELIREEYLTVLRRTAQGTLRYESEVSERVIEQRTIEAGTVRGQFEFTPPETGSYRLVVRDPESGAQSSLGFHATGWGYAPWALADPTRVEIDVEGDELAPGERARVQVRSPFPGKLLLTVEREGVLHSEVHVLDGNTASLSVPIAADYAPNVYLTATVVRAAGDFEPGMPARAFGARSIGVDRARHQLPLEIAAPDEMRPGQPLAVRVRTKPNAWVTVSAVDEGVLQLIGQQTPDPFGHFYRKRALAVQASDLFASLAAEIAVETAAAGGGSAIAGATEMLRTAGIRREKPVSLWSGHVRADASGWAEARFDVPAFQGALRLTAVAHQARAFGSGQRELRVRDPLVLLPTFPRFLSENERVEIPVTVRNDLGRAGTFAVSLGIKGDATPAGPTAQNVELADGSEQTVRFRLDTGDDPGDVVFTLRADGEGETSTTSRTLTLRSPLPEITLEHIATVEAGTTRVAIDGGALRPAGQQRGLRVSAHPLVRLSRPLSEVLHYPYGCLEQTVSRAFPLLAIGSLAASLEPELFEKANPDTLVASGIARIAAMQLPSGGFALWPRSHQLSLWPSLYATHFLVESQSAGHGISSTVIDRALDWTAQQAVAKPRYSKAELERVAYALYVLARADRPDIATLDFVRENHRDALSATSRVLVGAAYAAAGQGDRLEELAGDIADAAPIARATGGNFGSTVRNRALLLLALQDAAPNDTRIPVLAKRLADEAGAGRWTTQEGAFALVALGQLYRDSADAELRGTVRVGGRVFARLDGPTTMLQDLPADGAIEIERTDGDDTPAWAVLRTRGTPRTERFSAASNGLEIKRKLLGREGEALRGPVAQGDIVVLRIETRSVEGVVENVAVQQRLPTGLEIENARLATTETLPWIQQDAAADAADLRDDRALIFRSVAEQWRRDHVVLRAVVPGRFNLPPVQAEAMYDPTLRATGPLAEITVEASP